MRISPYTSNELSRQINLNVSSQYNDTVSDPGKRRPTLSDSRDHAIEQVTVLVGFTSTRLRFTQTVSSVVAQSWQLVLSFMLVALEMVLSCMLASIISDTQRLSNDDDARIDFVAPSSPSNTSCCRIRSESDVHQLPSWIEAGMGDSRAMLPIEKSSIARHPSTLLRSANLRSRSAPHSQFLRVKRRACYTGYRSLGQQQPRSFQFTHIERVNRWTNSVTDGADGSYLESDETTQLVKQVRGKLSSQQPQSTNATDYGISSARDTKADGVNFCTSDLSDCVSTTECSVSSLHFLESSEMGPRLPDHSTLDNIVPSQRSEAKQTLWTSTTEQTYEQRNSQRASSDSLHATVDQSKLLPCSITESKENACISSTARIRAPSTNSDLITINPFESNNGALDLSDTPFAKRVLEQRRRSSHTSQVYRHPNRRNIGYSRFISRNRVAASSFQHSNAIPITKSGQILQNNCVRTEVAKSTFLQDRPTQNENWYCGDYPSAVTHQQADEFISMLMKAPTIKMKTSGTKRAALHHIKRVRLGPEVFGLRVAVAVDANEHISQQVTIRPKRLRNNIVLPVEDRVSPSYNHHIHQKSGDSNPISFQMYVFATYSLLRRVVYASQWL